MVLLDKLQTLKTVMLQMTSANKTIQAIREKSIMRRKANSALLKVCKNIFMGPVPKGREICDSIVNKAIGSANAFIAFLTSSNYKVITIFSGIVIQRLHYHLIAATEIRLNWIFNKRVHIVPIFNSSFKWNYISR